MKRYKYGLNSQVLTTANFQELTTIGIIPVVPGDTIGGKSQIQTLTEATSKVINNRTYQDVYAFYVPYRLVFDQWPDFIAGDDTIQLPTASSNSGLWKMQMNSKLNDSVGGPSQCNNLGQRAYNLIWNKFFRTPTAPELDLDQNEVQRAPLRSTTLNQRFKDEITLQDQTIDVSGSTITTSDIRTAFSQDRFEKTRAFYGNKYTDYLAALGVEASWSILDEPELVGMSNNKLRYNMVDSTSEQDVGDPDPGHPKTVGAVGGRWQGSQMLSLRRTFAPEHGIVMIMQTVRMDLEINNAKGALEGLKLNRDQFYSPEFETERKEQWYPYSDPTAETPLYLEKYDNYRTGQNLTDVDNPPPGRSGTYINAPDLGNPTSLDILYPDISNLDEYLRDQYLGTEINLSCMHRISKVSPVRPAQSVHGVS